MNMVDEELKKEEYSGFRQELNNIILARYTILGFVLGALGVFTGLIINATNSNVNIFGQSLSLTTTIPLVYFVLLFIGMLITSVLTVHYRRLDAYCWVRYCSEQGLPFQRAYERFQYMSKFKWAYNEPLTYSYIPLSLLALFISTINVSLPINWLWILGMSLLFISMVIFPVIMHFCIGRNLTTTYCVRWLNSLDFIGNNPINTVFLDRDGVINENKPNGVTSQNLFVFIDGAQQALAKLSRKMLNLVVVTNQPYVGSGQMTEQVLYDIHKSMINEIAKAGGYIRRIYSCIHLESQQCSCRKPKIGLFEQASVQLGVNLKGSWVIGDQYSDIEAGRKIGARTILVLTGEGKNTRDAMNKNIGEIKPDKIVANLSEAASFIIEQEKIQIP